MEIKCEIYVSNFSNEKELLESLKRNLERESPILQGKHRVIFNSGEIYIDYNETFSWDKQNKFPDGFLYFPYILEVDLFCDSFQDAINLLNELLDSFWAQGKPAVVAR